MSTAFGHGLVGP